MPKRPNKLARILVPIALFVVGLGIPVAFLINTRNAQQPAQTPPPAARGAPAPVTTDAGEQPEPPVVQAEESPAQEPFAQEPPEASVQPDEELATLTAGGFTPETFEGDPLAKDFTPIGGLGFDQPYELRVEFSPVGAGVQSIRLARELDSVRSDRAARDGEIVPERHVQVQGTIASSRPVFDELAQPVMRDGQPVTQEMLLIPLAAADLEVNGQTVPLHAGPAGEPVWRQVSRGSAGVFEAFVLDGAGERIARIERRYRLPEGSFDLEIRQKVENLSDTPLTVRWRQFGQVDMASDGLGYGGDKRRVRFGYLLDPRADPSRRHVMADDFLWRRDKIAGSSSAEKFPGGVIWPNTRSTGREYELSWVGVTNRYFSAVLHPIVDPESPQASRVFVGAQTVKRAFGLAGEVILAVEGPRVEVPPGGRLNAGMSLYAGPMSTEVIGDDAELEALGVPGIVVFNFGGPCAFCTFPWLTGPLLGLLRVLHDLTHDWGFAIILLVVCVRSVLHPITRWSQIRMQKFTKQMQNMGPKQKIIQEKFKDDKQRMQQEMAKLWREEGVSPAGFLGCLPMFLQSPIWIALYATLYFAIDLRHEPAFFGVFQAITNDSWPFLADLAEPDRAIYFGTPGIQLPLMGTITSFNILPLFLGVVFYVHQKYLTPPPTASLTPEQETQQKMMKIMMVVLFPVIMYNAPAGLALYFITNSALGILESRWIRAHVEKHGLLDEDKLKKNPKQGGFMARLKEMAAQQQQLQQQRQAAGPKHAPRPGGRGGKPPPRRFKKR